MPQLPVFIPTFQHSKFSNRASEQTRVASTKRAEEQVKLVRIRWQIGPHREEFGPFIFKDCHFREEPCSLHPKKPCCN
jgi:hypothetical protein